MKIRNLKLLRGLLGATSLLVMAGCATDVPLERKTQAESVGETQAASVRVQAAAPLLTEARATQRPSNIRVREGIYLGDQGFRSSNGDPLPAQFEGPDGFVFNNPEEIGLVEIFDLVTLNTGIEVDYGDLAVARALGIGVQNSSPSSAPADGAASLQDSSDPFAALAPPAPTVSDSSGAASGGAEGPTELMMSVNYAGSLSGFLSRMANYAGVDWTYEGGRIVLQGPKTRSYTVWALPSDVSTTGTVGGGGGGFGAGTPATTTSTTAYNYWEAFEGGLAAIIPGTTSSFSINRASGTIVITGPQNIHRRAASFIQEENNRLSRQVSVKVEIVAFDTKDSDQRGVNLDGILSTLGNRINLSLASPATSIAGAASIGATVIDGRHAGTAGFVQALAQYGRAALVSSTSVVAMNNMPTPVSITSERAYLAEQTTTVADGVTSVSLETGLITTGLNMNVTPRVLSSGEVLVTYNMNITDLTKIEQFNAPDGSAAIQLPETSSRNFMQTVNIASGDSLVIAAYDSSANRRNSSGPFNPSLWGLGGESGFSADSTRIMIIMTPVVIENNNAPRLGR